MAKIYLSVPMILADLPNEVLGKILDFVSFNDLFSLERVNKRLRDVVLNIAWPKKDTINHETLTKYNEYTHDRNVYGREIKRYSFNDKYVEMLLSRTKHNLKHLNLSFYYEKISSQICFQLYLAPQLISLDLIDLRLNDDTLKVIAISCPLLEKVSIVNGLIGNIENGLKFLSKRCKNIKHLDLSGNSVDPGECFVYIPTELQYLNLSKSSYLHADVMDFIVNKASKNLEALLIGVYSINDTFKPYSNWFQKLNKLRFFDFTCSYGNLPLLDFSSLEEIEMLRLFGSWIITIKNLESLKSCPKLKGLELSFNNETFDGSALEILKEYKALKYCALRGWENLNNNLVDFVQTCKIEYLSLYECEDLSEDVLKALICECDSLSRLEVMRTNNSEIFSKILFDLSKDNYKRSNILKLVISTQRQTLPSFKWCQIIPTEEYDELSPEKKSIRKAIEQNKTFL